jgi:hypothetical protein
VAQEGTPRANSGRNTHTTVLQTTKLVNPVKPFNFSDLRTHRARPSETHFMSGYGRWASLGASDISPKALIRMAKSGPSRNPNFLNAFSTLRPQKKEKHSPKRNRLPQLPAQSALSSAFMFENTFFEKLGFGLGSDLKIIGNLKSNMMSKIEF